ncbi:MAG: protein-L-isoaspartate O-methyltransferase [Erythrobacter sp.]
MTQTDMTIARKAMIDSQLRTSGVNQEFVLARMNSVAREEFIPDAVKPLAYMDRAIPLGEGQYLPSPVVHGKMLSEAAPRLADTVLVVENGASYLAELLRPLVSSVETMSAQDAVGKPRGRKTYSLILIDGAVEELSSALEKRLEDGGRIVTGVVTRGVTRLASGRKVAGNVALQPFAEIGIPVLAMFAKTKSWSF